VPNLVNVVKGYAAHEKDVVHQRDRSACPCRRDPGDARTHQRRTAFQKFIAAQGELTGAISRLLLVAENYRNSRLMACPRFAGAARGTKTASPSRATATSTR